MKRRLSGVGAICLLSGMAAAQSTTAAPPVSTTDRTASPPSAATGAGIRQTEPASPPAHPITADQTRQMFKLMSFDTMLDGLMQQIISQQSAEAPFVPVGVWDDFRATFKKTDFVAIFLPVYQKYLSEDDAARALDFYASPAGQRMLKTMPPMMAEVSALGAQRGQEIAQQVFDRHRGEVEAAARKYRGQQDPAPQKTSPRP